MCVQLEAPVPLFQSISQFSFDLFYPLNKTCSEKVSPFKCASRLKHLYLFITVYLNSYNSALIRVITPKRPPSAFLPEFSGKLLKRSKHQTCDSYRLDALPSCTQAFCPPANLKGNRFHVISSASYWRLTGEDVVNISTLPRRVSYKMAAKNCN